MATHIRAQYNFRLLCIINCPRLLDDINSSQIFVTIHIPSSAGLNHYADVIMGTMASQITTPTIVYSTVYSGADKRKHQSSASLAFVRGIHRWPGNSPHKWPVTRKMFPFDDVTMVNWFERDHPCNCRCCSIYLYQYICKGTTAKINMSFFDFRESSWLITISISFSLIGLSKWSSESHDAGWHIS